MEDDMKKLYELSGGETFRHGNVNWRVDEFFGDHRGCRPAGDPACGSYVLFHIDEEVMVYEW